MKVFVPLDGSERSRSAIGVASTLAASPTDSIALLYAHWPGIPQDPGDQALEAEVASLQASGRSAEGVHRSTPRDEETGRVIAEAALEGAADFIVMTTHGRGGLGRWLFGSVAEQVIREADTPVLLIPNDLEVTWPADLSQTVLLALDQSELSQRAVAPAVQVAQALRSELVLIHVLSKDASAQEELDAQAHLNDVAAQVRAQGLEARTLLRRGEASQVISTVAHELSVLAVALGTHSGAVAKRATLGSVAMGIVRRTDVPVLLV